MEKQVNDKLDNMPEEARKKLIKQLTSFPAQNRFIPTQYVYKLTYEQAMNNKQYYQNHHKKIVAIQKMPTIEYAYGYYPFVRDMICTKYKITQKLFEVIMILLPFGFICQSDLKKMLLKMSINYQPSFLIKKNIITQKHELEGNNNVVHVLTSYALAIAEDFLREMNHANKNLIPIVARRQNSLFDFDEGDEFIRPFLNKVHQIIKRVREKLVPEKATAKKIEKVKRNQVIPPDLLEYFKYQYQNNISTLAPMAEEFNIEPRTLQIIAKKQKWKKKRAMKTKRIPRNQKIHRPINNKGRVQVSVLKKILEEANKLAEED